MIEILIWIMLAINAVLFVCTKDKHDRMMDYMTVWFLLIILWFMKIDSKIDKLQINHDKQNKTVEVCNDNK